MSKHMKPEAISNDDFYRARIKHLEDENTRLRAEVVELKKVADRAELAMEHEKKKRDVLADERHKERAAMELRIKRLEAAIVKNALREV